MSSNSATRHGAKYHGTKDKIEDINGLNWPDKEILLRNKACDLGIWEGMTGGECLLALAIAANKDNPSKMAAAKLVLSQASSRMITFIYETLSKNDKSLIEQHMIARDLKKLWEAIKPTDVSISIFKQEEVLMRMEVSSYNNVLDYMFAYNRDLQRLYSTEVGKGLLKEEVAVCRALSKIPEGVEHHSLRIMLRQDPQKTMLGLIKITK